MNDPLLRAFRGQARACAALGSPFMERLMDLFAARLGADGAVADGLLAWEGDVTSGGHSVPLRIAGALHGLVLDGAAPDLAAVYPPHAVNDDALWQAVAAARITHEDRVMTWLDQAPQTNEVRRAAALIIARGAAPPCPCAFGRTTPNRACWRGWTFTDVGCSFPEMPVGSGKAS